MEWGFKSRVTFSCFARVKKRKKKSFERERAWNRGSRFRGVVNEPVATIILQNPAVSRSTGRQVSSFAVLTFDDRSAASIVEIFFGSVIDNPEIIRQSRDRPVCHRVPAVCRDWKKNPLVRKLWRIFYFRHSPFVAIVRNLMKFL